MPSFQWLLKNRLNSNALQIFGLFTEQQKGKQNWLHKISSKRCNITPDFNVNPVNDESKNIKVRFLSPRAATGAHKKN